MTHTYRSSNRMVMQSVSSRTMIRLMCTLSVLLSAFWTTRLSLHIDRSTGRHTLEAHQCYLSETSQNRSSNSLYYPEDGAKTKKDRIYNFTVAICMVVSDGEQYFQEWVDYHLLVMNFEAIYVYDNSEKFDLERWFQNTRHHPIYSRVVIEHRPGIGKNDGKGRHLQKGVYEDCIARYGKSDPGPKHDYFALIDNDEFLVPQNLKYDSIHSILEEYLVPFGGALVSNWILFGTSNRTVYSPVPVLKRFQYRDQNVHNVVKSIVKASDFKSCRNPHAVVTTNPRNIHTSEFPGAIQANVYDKRDRTKASSLVRAKDVLLVYHYRYTSEKEYHYKRCIRKELIGGWCDDQKGGIKNTTKTPYHIHTFPGEVFDGSAWKLLALRVPKYRVFDNPDWEDFM